MFEIILYKNKAERNRVDKSTYIEKCAELKGTLRESTSILTPVITIQFGKKEIDVVESNSEWVIWNGNKVVITLEEVLSCNYVYIPMFKRYYFIDDIVSVRNGLWQISMSVDFLMSFKDKIYAQRAFIERSERFYDDSYVDDMLPIKSSYLQQIQLPPTSGLNKASFYCEYRYPEDGIGDTYEFELKDNYCVAVNVLPAANVDTEEWSSTLTNPFVTPSNVTYIMGYKDFIKFIDRALDPSSQNSSINNYLNISDCICSINLLPFSIDDLNVIGGGGFGHSGIDRTFGPSLIRATEETVYVGGYKLYDSNNPLDYNMYVVSKYAKFRFGFDFKGAISSFGTFISHPPYSDFKVVIPYMGVFDVDYNAWVNNYKYLNFILDPNTFECVAYWSKDKSTFSGNDLSMFHSYSGVFSVSYGIGRTNASERHMMSAIRDLKVVRDVNSLGGSIINNAASIVTNPVNAITTIGKTILDAGNIATNASIDKIVNNVPKINTSKIVSSVVDIQQCNIPYILLNQVKYSYPENYNRLYGRPCMQTKVISEFGSDCFIKVQHIQYIGDGISTVDEETNIVQQLKNGVIL